MSISKKVSISSIFLLAAMYVAISPSAERTTSYQTARSLIAAIIRLVVKEETSHGGYTAHIDIDRKLPSPHTDRDHATDCNVRQSRSPPYCTGV